MNLRTLATCIPAVFLLLAIPAYAQGLGLDELNDFNFDTLTPAWFSWQAAKPSNQEKMGLSNAQASELVEAREEYAKEALRITREHLRARKRMNPRYSSVIPIVSGDGKLRLSFPKGTPKGDQERLFNMSRKWSNERLELAKALFGDLAKVFTHDQLEYLYLQTYMPDQIVKHAEFQRIMLFSKEQVGKFPADVLRLSALNQREMIQAVLSRARPSNGRLDAWELTDMRKRQRPNIDTPEQVNNRNKSRGEKNREVQERIPAGGLGTNAPSPKKKRP